MILRASVPERHAGLRVLAYAVLATKRLYRNIVGLV